MTVCFLSFDVEDWFQVENLRTLFPPSTWDDLPRRLVASTYDILEILDNHGLSATFFFLGWIAEREPQLVRDIVQAGHDLACHSYLHVMPMKMSLDDFREDTKRAQDVLQDIAGHPVVGYRAPSFSLGQPHLDILADMGFRFDSSYHPFSLHNRYGRFSSGEPLGAGVSLLDNGMFEFGLPVVQVGPFSLPVSGGGYFRMYPGLLFRALFRRVLAKDGGGGGVYIFTLGNSTLSSQRWAIYPSLTVSGTT